MTTYKAEADIVAHPTPGLNASPAANDFDEAYAYLKHTSGAAKDNANIISLKALRRKVDWRIVPIMFCCYTMQFVDKVLLNVSPNGYRTYYP